MINISGITLGLTDACNLACKYCFVQQKPNFMSYETAKQAVDFLVQHNNNNTPLSIHFFGGEPTLMWDSVIVPTVEYIETFKRDISIGMTSNGVLLSVDKINYLKEHNINLLLSCDGDKVTQDYNRPQHNGHGSFNLIVENLQHITEILPETVFRGTIYPDTCEYLFDNIMFAQSKGFSHCFFCPDTFSDWSDKQLSILQEEIRKYSIYFINSCRLERPFILFNPILDMLNYNFDINNYNFSSKCGFGNGNISINYKGDILACQEMCSLENPSYFYLGNIYNFNEQEYFENQNKLMNTFLDELSNGIILNNLCNQCEIEDYCQLSVCQANCYIKSKKFYIKPGKIDCIWKKTLYKEAHLINDILLLNNNIFFQKHFK